MLVDFADIKKTVQQWIDDNLDHNMLLCRDDPILPMLGERGERVFVMDCNPTAENIARLIYEHAREPGCRSSKSCSGKPSIASRRMRAEMKAATAALNARCPPPAVTVANRLLGGQRTIRA